MIYIVRLCFYMLIYALCALFFALHAAPNTSNTASNPSTTQAKNAAKSPQNTKQAFRRPEKSAEQILHLQNITPESILTAPIYIGQRIPITYRVLLFHNATINQSTFTNSTTTNAFILENPNESWRDVANNAKQASMQKTYEITYIFKITAQTARIPALEVSALSSNGAYIDAVRSEPITINATNLYQNANYAGVIGEQLTLGIYKAKPYDDNQNLIAFELLASHANLEDFKLPHIEKQGIERSTFTPQESKAIFYAIVPKSLQHLSIEYFSTSTNRFEQLTIPIIPIVEGVTTQESLKPKNTHLLYWMLFIGSIALMCFVIGFFSARLRKPCIAFGCIAILYLLYHTLYTKTAIIPAQTNIWILPTHNSTLLTSTTDTTQIKIIGEHGQYYKIITPQEAIGWIRKIDAR